MMEDCLGNVSDGMANEYYGYHDTPSMTHEERKERQATDKMAARKRVHVDTRGMELDDMRMLRNLLDDAIFQEEEKARKPKEPEGGDGTIISFTKRFNRAGTREGTAYYYAAIKARGGWSVTGQSGLNGIGWERLLNFIQDEESNPRRALSTLKVVYTV